MRKASFRLVLMAVTIGVAAGMLVGGTLAVVSSRTDHAATSLMPGQADVVSQVVDVGLGKKVDPVGMLGVVHERILQSGGALVLGELSDVGTAGTKVTGVIAVSEVKWETPQGLFKAGDHVSVLTSELAEEEMGQFVALTDGLATLALITNDGELLGISELAPGQGVRAVTDPVPHGPLFLGAAASALAETGFPAVPGDACGISEHIGLPTRPAVEALIAYFTELGTTTREERIAALAAVDVEVERLLESAPRMTDAVTGVDVPIAINDLHRQVSDGADSITYRPMYPMSIRLDDIDLESQAVLVFADAVTGEVTSWIDLAPTGWVDDKDEIHWNDTLTVFVEAPNPGNDVEIFLRSIDGYFECPPLPTEKPLFTIGYDQAFGAKRAVVDLRSLAVSDLDPARMGGGS